MRPGMSPGVDLETALQRLVVEAENGKLERSILTATPNSIDTFRSLLDSSSLRSLLQSLLSSDPPLQAPGIEAEKTPDDKLNRDGELDFTSAMKKFAFPFLCVIETPEEFTLSQISREEHCSRT